jgi:hypothetical protein
MYPASGGLCGKRWAFDHRGMEKAVETQKKPRPPSDFLGAIGFVVLITTVIYAVLTAG